MITRSLLGDILSVLSEPGPLALVLVGPPRSGKSWLLRESTGTVAGSRPVFWLRGSDLPASLMAREAVATLRRQREGTPEVAHGSGEGEPWAELAAEFRALAETDRPPVLVVDRADALLQDRRFVAVLADWWRTLRGRSRRAHLIVAVERGESLTAWTESDARNRPDPSLRTLSVGPLGLREAGAVVPGWRAADVVELYGLVGGLPDFWSRVRGGRSPRANLRRLLLEPGAPLRHLPYLLLGQAPPGPDRQWAVLSAMARGARSWGEIRREAGVFRSSSELGPYLKGLLERRLVEGRRSLDAAPRSRNRRYHLSRPLVGFWLGIAHPHLPELDRGDPFDEVWDRRMSHAVGTAVRRRLPVIVEQHLHAYGNEQLPGRARETGGLWGDGYDLPVSGTLETGAAFYGEVRWDGAGGGALGELDRQIQETRYGFNREARLRIIVVRDPPAHELTRAVARAGDAWVLTPEDLLGRA